MTEVSQTPPPERPKDQPPPSQPVRVVQRKPVGWFSLRLLLRNGLLALITLGIGTRTGRREVLAALDPNGCAFDLPSHYPGRRRWIDYVADTGDGFNATFSIAWLIGRDRLGLSADYQPLAQPVPASAMDEAQQIPDADLVLPAGDALIMGGDQVYPYSTDTEYEDRLLGVYHAARPWDLSEYRQKQGRRLFVLPGNHDWYDGLGGFVRAFCQPGRWRGAWQLTQVRSYFAINLGDGFWIWGLDLATDDDLDTPQLKFFENCAAALHPGEQVILCIPTPSWHQRDLDAEREPRDTTNAWHKTRTVEDLVRAAGGGSCRVPLMLSGDLHHYSHYVMNPNDPETRQDLITCGGGGAYLLGTQNLPEKLDLRLDVNERQRQARLNQTFPDKPTCLRQRHKVMNLPFRFWPLCFALGTVMAMVAALLVRAWDFAARPVWSEALMVVLFGSPLALFVTVAVGAGFVNFAASGAPKKHLTQGSVWAIGLAHYLAQILIAILVRKLVLSAFPALDEVSYPLLIVMICGAIGWLSAGMTLAAYLYLSNVTFGFHSNEVFSAQAIQDWKCFLRMSVDEDGLTVYPIGLQKVGQDWRSAGAVATDPAKPRTLLQGQDVTYELPRHATRVLDPATPLQPQLIHVPIHIPNRVRTA